MRSAIAVGSFLLTVTMIAASCAGGGGAGGGGDPGPGDGGVGTTDAASPDAATVVPADAGTAPDAAIPCTSSAPPPRCCDGDGKRVSSATCEAGAFACGSAAALCTCQGVAGPWVCVGFCGDDVAVDPTCTDAGWACGHLAPLRSDTCPVDTCWGEPGDCACCADEGAGASVWPGCDAGAWVCPAGAARCASCG